MTGYLFKILPGNISYNKTLPVLVALLVLSGLIITASPAFSSEKDFEKTGIFSIETTDARDNKVNSEENLPGEDSDNINREFVTLEDCIHLAFERHPSLRQSFALREAARARVVQSRASFYPSLGLSSSYSHSVSKTTRTQSGVVLPVAVSRTDYYSNRVSVNQMVYDFGRTRYRVLSASENLKAAHYDLLAEADAIILAIREAYFKSVAARKAFEVQQEAVFQQELHLKQARGFYEIGRRSKIEVTKAEVDLAEAELELIRAENALNLSRYVLANTIGIKGSFDYALDDQVQMAEVEMSRDEAVEFARARRPEMLRMSALEKINEAGLNIARAAYYPRINSSGGLGYGDNRLAFEDFSWNWGVTLQFDIFTSGERAGAVQEATQQLEAQVASRDRLWQNIHLEVQEAFLNKEEARKRIAVVEKTLDNARENFALAQGRYEVGLSDNLEFNDARLALQRAKMSLISAVLDYQTARARLEKATGTTLLARLKIEEMGDSPVEFMETSPPDENPPGDKDGEPDGK